MARVRGDYVVNFGLICGCLANLLFAVPIPPSTSYFAYGFISMTFSAFAADTVYPVIGLFTTQSLPRKDQAVGGALFQTMGGLARAISMPITSVIQTEVQANLVRSGAGESKAFLGGTRAVEWFCFACGIVSILIGILGLRNIGKVGLLKKLGTVSSAAAEKTTGEKV